MAALRSAEKVFSLLANHSADDPIRMRFSPDAQALFDAWIAELENKIRSDASSMLLVTHLAKYRSLFPTLAGLFELADLAASDKDLSGEVLIDLEHARQAGALCEYLESHARRVYSAVISPERRAANELARHIRKHDLPDGFPTRSVYLKNWAGLGTPELARGALVLLEDAGWLRRREPTSSREGGRPSETWVVNPKVVAREK